jgi:hypothetical protein
MFKQIQNMQLDSEDSLHQEMRLDDDNDEFLEARPANKTQTQFIPLPQL